jgi:AmmeMemoRadiSam system protein A
MNQLEQKQFLQLARQAIKAEFDHTKCDTDFPGIGKKAATFVTLTKNGQLRGCIGCLEPIESLTESIKHNAINAAFNDYRFQPLTQGELNQVKIEISILSQPEAINFTDQDDLLSKIRPNIDGLILSADGKSATFLPQVWEDLPDKHQFIASLLEKARLSKNRFEQPGVKAQKYQVEHFCE